MEKCAKVVLTKLEHAKGLEKFNISQYAFEVGTVFLKAYSLYAFIYSGTSVIQSPMGLSKSDLNGEVTVLQGAKLHCGIQKGVNNDNLLSITLHNQVRTAKLCLINSRSVYNKAEFLVDYVTSHDIDIMCITETWLRSEDTASASVVTPSGYHLEHAARSNGHGGGVGVLFRSSFHIDHSQLWPASSFESLDLQLRCRSVSSTLRLFVVYRPPSSSRNSQPFAIFLSLSNFEILLNASPWNLELSYSDILTCHMAITTMPTLEPFTTYYQTPT